MSEAMQGRLMAQIEAMQGELEEARRRLDVSEGVFTEHVLSMVMHESLKKTRIFQEGTGRTVDSVSRDVGVQADLRGVAADFDRPVAAESRSISLDAFNLPSRTEEDVLDDAIRHAVETGNDGLDDFEEELAGFESDVLDAAEEREFENPSSESKIIEQSPPHRTTDTVAETPIGVMARPPIGPMDSGIVSSRRSISAENEPVDEDSLTRNASRRAVEVPSSVEPERPGDSIESGYALDSRSSLRPGDRGIDNPLARSASISIMDSPRVIVQEAPKSTAEDSPRIYGNDRQIGKRRDSILKWSGRKDSRSSISSQQPLLSRDIPTRGDGVIDKGLERLTSTADAVAPVVNAEDAAGMTAGYVSNRNAVGDDSANQRQPILNSIERGKASISSRRHEGFHQIDGARLEEGPVEKSSFQEPVGDDALDQLREWIQRALSQSDESITTRTGVALDAIHRCLQYIDQHRFEIATSCESLSGALEALVEEAHRLINDPSISSAPTDRALPDHLVRDLLYRLQRTLDCEDTKTEPTSTEQQHFVNGGMSAVSPPTEIRTSDARPHNETSFDYSPSAIETLVDRMPLSPKRVGSFGSLDSVLSDLSRYLSTQRTAKQRWQSAFQKIRRIRAIGGSRWKTIHSNDPIWKETNTKITVKSNLEIFLYGYDGKDKSH